MIRGLILCATACGIATPAIARERSAALPVLRVIPKLIVPVPERAPNFRGIVSVLGDFVVRLRGVPAHRMTLAEFEKRPVVRAEIVPPQALLAEPITLTSPFAISELRTVAAWRITGRLPPVTSSANGSYAVRDALANYRKPRVFRPSALSATLVLRIDGRDESPPFSVGGGGVAAALWRFKQQ